MVNYIIKCFRNLDKEIKSLMMKGLFFSLCYCALSSVFLIVYHFFLFPFCYHWGTILFKSSLTIGSSFIVIGIGFDKIKKQMA